LSGDSISTVAFLLPLKAHRFHRAHAYHADVELFAGCKVLLERLVGI
jgi:hypothetical protein